MRRFAIFYLEVSAFALIFVSNSHDSQRRNRYWKVVNGEQNVIRSKRTFGSSEPPCNTTNGVYLEKWEKIDYKRIRFLLEDPRYPNLPSFSTCIPTFEQPSNWGDFFGSRLRTYFVPFQTGDHYFFLSSNAGSALFLSTNSSAGGKTLITYVDGGFPTKKYEYDRYTNQKTLPISLKKGKYYYMEAIMKDDHQEDHLEVGLQTPDGTFYKVIPSEFLWTTVRLSASQNFTYQSILIKVAAKAGASAGSSFGAKYALKSGAEAGAIAGGIAGGEAGASAGAAAGERAAIQMTRKTIEDALNSLHGDSLRRYNIILRNGNVVAVTGPGLDGAEEAGATSGGAGGGIGPNEAGGTSGSAGNGGGGSSGGGGAKGSGKAGTGTGAAASGIGAGTAGGFGTGAGAGVGKTTGAGASGSVSGSTEGATSAGALVSGSVGGGVGGGAGSSGGRASITGGMLSGSISHRQVTYIPKPGEDPQSLARSLVWRAGGATKLVDKGLYTVHSFDVPYQQENTSLNFCWQAHNGDLALRAFCQVFQARIPGLYKADEKKNETVSFESVCLPGYFMRQKNYHFILEKRDGSNLFDKESSFTVYSVMKISRNLMLQSMHKDWYVCQSKTKVKEKTDIKLDFYNGKPDVLNRCTFMFHPIAQNADKYRMCKNVLGPLKHPEIVGQPLPHPPHLVPRKPNPRTALPACIPIWAVGSTEEESGKPRIVSPSVSTNGTVNTAAKMCVALNFVNNFGSPFKLYSSLKNEGYLVTGNGLNLKLIIARPELHSHVTFYAEDLTGRKELLLNGASSISEPTILGCPKFLTVSVTSGRELIKGGLPASATLTSASSASNSMSHHPGAHPPHPPPVYSLPNISASAASPPPAVAPPPAAVPPPAVVPPPATASVASQSGAPGQNKSHQDHKVIHYHYHYNDRDQPETTTEEIECPSTCATSDKCHPSCPLFCCKRSNVISTATRI